MLAPAIRAIGFAALCLTFFSGASPASARETAADPFGWDWEPSIAVPLFAFGLLLFIGLVNRALRSNSTWQWKVRSLCLIAGWVSLFLALESPIHELGERLFWVHMTQHEILMLVCAPLLVLGQPLVVLLSALPRSIRNLCARILHARIVRAAGNLISRPLVAWCLSAAALWVWHAPSLFDATLHSDWIHALQHLSFLLTAILFWWSLLESRRRAVDYGASILFVFTTAVHTSLLGVLLTFSSKPWYPSYALTAPKLGYSPLEDQQIGGLIMWVPAGVLLTVIALLMVPAWLRSSDKRYALWCEPASPSNTVSRS